MTLVSVVIPTYNRFTYLMRTIESVKKQTYSEIEIIVVNDRSTQKEYYDFDWKDIIVIHLEENSKKKFGFACAGYVRNQGIKIANGSHIAFCDDDDIWFPQKIELQLEKMKKTGCQMSSTDGLIGNGPYEDDKKYKKYNAEHYFNQLQSIYRKRSKDELKDGFPEIWDLNFVKVHNCVICSSVLIAKHVLDKIENMKCVKNGREDYDCWKRILGHTNSAYVTDICFYYDAGHGDGRNY